ncbi:HNH endonuclease [Burkholderia stagnalis]|uniref:HNH endonuclease n=1 Tax=Burkholderia stagnalis TaxID=1503054 RepID=UPI000F5DFE1F|nr:HNH endonuclease [Burkholderia stagnalis]RQZ08894.1 HNH endonuclease [Burkholderia stagnalis]
MEESIVSRFWREVDVRADNECWPWMGELDEDGYGERFKVRQKRYRPHRVACELAHGQSGMLALHTCNNRACCNPSHIRWGTAKQNTADMLEAGTMAKGSDHPAHKLNEAVVAEIREMARAGTATRALARQFSISQTQARRIVSGVSWRHV